MSNYIKQKYSWVMYFIGDMFSKLFLHTNNDFCYHIFCECMRISVKYDVLGEVWFNE